ncbi:hypothetical protein ACFQZT_04315 [Paenibacillus sp. GCM10027628]|uniref:hypothetical protein n=1 Tax=Paenibacillus sp. GCM10027628 TaxID=3273413 RepID=UPI0036305C64
MKKVWSPMAAIEGEKSAQQRSSICKSQIKIAVFSVTMTKVALAQLGQLPLKEIAAQS